MPAAINLTGQRFGFLTAIQPCKHGGIRAWICKCDCGNETRVTAGNLRIGHSESCGCRDGGHGKPELTHERLLELFRYEPATGLFFWREDSEHFKAAQQAGYYTQGGYVRISVDGRGYFAHNLAWFHMNCEWPEKEIDHRDRRRDNNKWENLRISGRTNNNANKNKQSNNRSGYKGVYWAANMKRWAAKIGFKKEQYFLGYFDDPKIAAIAYDAKAKELFGEFARTNFGENGLCRPQ